MYEEGGEWEEEGGERRTYSHIHDIKTPALRVLKQNQKPYP